MSRARKIVCFRMEHAAPQLPSSDMDGHRSQSNGSHSRVAEFVAKLSSAEDEEALAMAASDLAMAALSPSVRAQLVRENAVSSLLLLLKAPHSAEALGHTVSTLTTLCLGGTIDVIEASSKNVRDRIAREGGIDVLMNLFDGYGTHLNTAGTLRKERPERLKLYAKVAECIHALCDGPHDENIQAFLDAGALHPLIALASTTEAKGAPKAAAAGWSAHLSSASSLNAAAVEARAGMALAALSSHPASQVRIFSQRHPRAQRQRPRLPPCLHSTPASPPEPSCASRLRGRRHSAPWARCHSCAGCSRLRPICAAARPSLSCSGTSSSTASITRSPSAPWEVGAQSPPPPPFPATACLSFLPCPPRHSLKLS